MKFALHPVIFINVYYVGSAQFSPSQAYTYIEQMYVHVYGSVGTKRSPKQFLADMTPNEERLVRALQDRFWSQGSMQPIAVQCDKRDIVFLRVLPYEGAYLPGL